MAASSGWSTKEAAPPLERYDLDVSRVADFLCSRRRIYRDH